MFLHRASCFTVFDTVIISYHNLPRSMVETGSRPLARKNSSPKDHSSGIWRVQRVQGSVSCRCAPFACCCTPTGQHLKFLKVGSVQASNWQGDEIVPLQAYSSASREAFGESDTIEVRNAFTTLKLGCPVKGILKCSQHGVLCSSGNSEMKNGSYTSLGEKNDGIHDKRSIQWLDKYGKELTSVREFEPRFSEMIHDLEDDDLLISPSRNIPALKLCEPRHGIEKKDVMEDLTSSLIAIPPKRRIKVPQSDATSQEHTILQSQQSPSHSSISGLEGEMISHPDISPLKLHGTTQTDYSTDSLLYANVQTEALRCLSQSEDTTKKENWIATDHWLNDATPKNEAQKLHITPRLLPRTIRTEYYLPLCKDKILLDGHDLLHSVSKSAPSRAQRAVSPRGRNLRTCPEIKGRFAKFSSDKINRKGSSLVPKVQRSLVGSFKSHDGLLRSHHHLGPWLPHPASTTKAFHGQVIYSDSSTHNNFHDVSKGTKYIKENISDSEHGRKEPTAFVEIECRSDSNWIFEENVDNFLGKNLLEGDLLCSTDSWENFPPDYGHDQSTNKHRIRNGSLCSTDGWEKSTPEYVHNQISDRQDIKTFLGMALHGKEPSSGHDLSPMEAKLKVYSPQPDLDLSNQAYQFQLAGSQRTITDLGAVTEPEHSQYASNEIRSVDALCTPTVPEGNIVQHGNSFRYMALEEFEKVVKELTQSKMRQEAQSKSPFLRYMNSNDGRIQNPHVIDGQLNPLDIGSSQNSQQDISSNSEIPRDTVDQNRLLSSDTVDFMSKVKIMESLTHDTNKSNVEEDSVTENDVATVGDLNMSPILASDKASTEFNVVVNDNPNIPPIPQHGDLPILEDTVSQSNIHDRSHFANEQTLECKNFQPQWHLEAFKTRKAESDAGMYKMQSPEEPTVEISEMLGGYDKDEVKLLTSHVREEGSFHESTCFQNKGEMSSYNREGFTADKSSIGQSKQSGGAHSRTKTSTSNTLSVYKNPLWSDEHTIDIEQVENHCNQEPIGCAYTKGHNMELLENTGIILSQRYSGDTWNTYSGVTDVLAPICCSPSHENERQINKSQCLIDVNGTITLQESEKKVLTDGPSSNQTSVSDPLKDCLLGREPEPAGMVTLDSEHINDSSENNDYALQPAIKQTNTTNMHQKHSRHPSFVNPVLPLAQPTDLEATVPLQLTWTKHAKKLQLIDASKQEYETCKLFEETSMDINTHTNKFHDCQVNTNFLNSELLKGSYFENANGEDVKQVTYMFPKTKSPQQLQAAAASAHLPDYRMDLLMSWILSCFSLGMKVKIRKDETEAPMIAKLKDNGQDEISRIGEKVKALEAEIDTFKKQNKKLQKLVKENEAFAAWFASQKTYWESQRTHNMYLFSQHKEDQIKSLEAIVADLSTQIKDLKLKIAAQDQQRKDDPLLVRKTNKLKQPAIPDNAQPLRKGASAMQNEMPMSRRNLTNPSELEKNVIRNKMKAVGSTSYKANSSDKHLHIALNLLGAKLLL